MSRLSCTLLVLLVTPSSIDAQTTANDSLRGTVKDEQKAVLPGTTVSVTSPALPVPGTAIADREGRYRFLDLPPGEYEATVELAGFAPFVVRSLPISAGRTLTLDIVMEVGGINERVEVTRQAPLLETQSSGHAVNISGELLRSMPLSERREWFGALSLAPGVTTGESVNNQKLIYVHGADATANVVQIDGADMTSTVPALLNYVSLNTDAIDDVQVKTAGVDASAPLGIGGVINIATASGTNRLRGAATVFVQPRTWNDSNTPGGTSSTVDQTQVDLSMGAPLIKDRLWAFGAYRHADIHNGVNRSPAQLEALRGLVPGFEPFDNTHVAHLWFAKLNAQLSSAHQVSGFYQRDVSPAAFADPVSEHPREEATGGTGVSVRLSSAWSDQFVSRLGASYNDKRRDVRNTVADQPLQRIYQATILSGSRLLGNGRLVDRGSPLTGGSTLPNSKLTLSFDATLFGSGRLGTHEVQTGIYLQPRTHVEQHDFYPNGGFVFEEAVLQQPGIYSSVVPFHRTVLDGESLTRVRRQGQDYAVYIQDAWQPVARLTINAGLRVDWVRWRDQQFGVTTQRSVEVGPRFGANYALTSDAHDIVKAHWVRVHDQPAATGMSVGSASLGQRDLYDLDLNGTFETLFITPATFDVTPGRSIDGAFHQPFIQEWGAGYSKQFAGSITANVDLVRRDYRDRGTLIETNGRYEGSQFVGYIDEGFNEIYVVTNNQWNSPVYTSLELSVTKRTSRIQGIASYVRQWRRMDGTWQPNDPASFIQPTAFANDRGIGSPLGSTSTPIDANSLSGTHMTQRSSGSSQWQDHAVRTGLAYRGPWDLLFGTSYTFQSGAWSGPIVTRLGQADSSFGPATVILSNGRSVQNPLATVLRFANSSRGEGQLKTPMLHVWNLRVGKRVVLRRLTIDGSLDVFNVTNHDADASFESSGNQTFSPLFGLTTFRQLPRSAQAVIRVSF